MVGTGQGVTQVYPEPKIICMVRDLRDVFASMEGNFRKHPEKQSDILDWAKGQGTTVPKRIDIWASQPPVGLALERLSEIFRTGINNKMLFARAIQLDAIIGCIQLYLSSLRSNSNQAHSAQLYEKIMIELEGTTAGSIVQVTGLKNQLVGEVTSIRSEIQKLRMGFRKANQFLVSTLI
jgi:hypothetical protein